MESKVHLRIADLELDCQGSEGFLRQELPKILDAITKLRQITPISNDPSNDSNDSDSAVAKPTKTTTTSVAARLGCSSGADLVTAAAAKLTVNDGLSEFSRDALHTEMKSASGFYKTTYTSNLSAYITSLVKSQKLLEVAAGKYAVPPKLKAEWMSKLA